MRPAGKARRPRISGIFEGGATQPDGMQRRPNAAGLAPRAAGRGCRRMRTSKSARLFARAQRILPGGVDSPVRAFKAVGASPLFIRRARGARLEDVDGNRFIDYVMSWGPLIHGHAPSGLVRAVAAAARHGTSYGAPSPLEVELGERVCGLMPSLERVRF